MGAPLDLDLGPEHFVRPARQEHSCASIDAIADKEAYRATVRRIRELIGVYERLRDWQMQQSRASERWEAAVSLKNQAKQSEQVVRDLSELVR